MSRTRHTRAAAIVAAGALAVGLAACSSSSSGSGSAAVPTGNPDAKVTVSFMEAMSSGAQQAALKKMTADFMAANPNITVDLQEQPNYGALQTKITAQTAAGQPPTIAQVYENWADDFASSKVIVPLDDYAKQSSDYASFPEGIKNDLKLTDGKTWMWPFNKSVVVQYYNQSMVPTAPKTWDEFATSAKSVSKGNVVALSIDPGSSTAPAGGTAVFEILAESMGSKVFADDGTPQFTSDGAKKAMAYLVDLKKANALALGTNYPGQTALGAGTGAYDISSVASYPFNLKAVGGKFPMGVATLPAGPSKTANQLAGTNIALFSAASDDQKAAAWKYMQFLTSAKEQAYWAIQSGYLPVNKASAQDPDFQAYAAKNPFVTDAIKQLDTATPLPPKKWVNQASGYLSVAIQSAVSGSASVDDALQKAQDSAMTAMKQSS